MRSSRSSVRAVAAAVGGAIAIAATASAVTASLRASGPPATDVDRSKLTRVVDHPTASVAASVWTAPTPDGRTCVFLPVAAAGTELAAADAFRAAAFCPIALEPRTLRSPRYATFTQWVPTQEGTFVPVVRGALGGGGIAMITAEGNAGGKIPANSARGYFTVELPAVPVRGELPAGGPFYLVGSDARGVEVFRLNLTETLEKGTPPADQG